MRTQREFLVDVLERLNRTGLDYMLTGPMASNYWGIPRTTHDLDFILALRGQASALVTAFQGGDFSVTMQPPDQFDVLDQPSALKAGIQFLGACEFDQSALGRRVATNILGIATWVTTPEDVILYELRANRNKRDEQRLLDTAGVFAVQRDVLAIPYLKEWAPILGVGQQLDDLLSGKLKPKTT